MLHPKIVLFKPFNLLIEHNQHIYSLAAAISLSSFYIYTLNISIGIAWYTTKINYTHHTDKNLKEYYDQCAIFVLIGISCNV